MQSFTDKEFEKYRRFIYEKSGIHLSDVKKDTLKAKLHKLMARNSLHSYGEYFDMLEGDRDKRHINEFFNEITINKTDFFRENNHFSFIKNKIGYILEKNPRIVRNKEIRVWSAGCSTGEEPYTLAFVLKECLPEEITIKILATDICSKVLITAAKGIYPARIRNEMDDYYLSRYFERWDNEYRVTDDIRKLVTLRQFNLMDPFPFSNTFDMTFCRNVMIYFDAKAQQSLLDKFYNVTAQGGLLFLGHSESLINKRHRYQYIQPTIYIK